MNDESMRLTLGMTKALSDIQRLRILMMLRPGELCVCQIIAVLGLAPSTVSKHLSILANARLVDSRKDGRWAYYRLASLEDTHAPLDWLATSLRQDGQIRVDQEKLAAINACDPQSIARRQRVSDKIAMTVRRGAPGGRARASREECTIGWGGLSEHAERRWRHRKHVAEKKQRRGNHERKSKSQNPVSLHRQFLS